MPFHYCRNTIDERIRLSDRRALSMAASSADLEFAVGGAVD